MPPKFTFDNEPNIVQAKDMTELWRKCNDSILWANKDKLDYYSSLDTMIGDCIGMSETAEFDLNIGRDLWVTPSRWNTLIRQYVDPQRLFEWLEGVKDIATYNRGICALNFSDVQRTVVASNARANRRKWGGCMRYLTYRAFPKPTVTLYSRTSYLGYIGGLDMLCAHKLAAMACDMLTADGLRLEDIAFRWHCEMWQFHGFKSMAYIFGTGQDKLMRRKVWPEDKLGPEENYPTWKLVRNWWRRIEKQDAEGKPYDEMKYGAEKRIRRRYHAQVGVDQTPFITKERAYAPLNTPIELISLDSMLYKTPESRAIIKKQKKVKSEKVVKELFDDEEGDDILIGVDGKVFQGGESDPTQLIDEDDLEIAL